MNITLFTAVFLKKNRDNVVTIVLVRNNSFMRERVIPRVAFYARISLWIGFVLRVVWLN